MRQRPSLKTRRLKRKWLPAAILIAALLLAVITWRSLRMPKPRPRRESPAAHVQPSP